MDYTTKDGKIVQTNTSEIDAGEFQAQLEAKKNILAILRGRAKDAADLVDNLQEDVDAMEAASKGIL